MTSEISVPNNKPCELCQTGTVALSAGWRCDACVRRGDLVGDIVWKRVAAEVEHAASGKRVMFMVTGLSAMFLEGIARKAPPHEMGVDGRGYVFAVHPKATRYLQVRDCAQESEESATHWRHSDQEEIILFAPSERDLDGIGAGLGSIARLDESEIMDQIPIWSELIGENGKKGEYVEKMLLGLRDSGIATNLRIWVDFILALKDQGFAGSICKRVQNAVNALHIPNHGVSKLPSSKQKNLSKINSNNFKVAFEDAIKNVGCYARLENSRQEPVDLDAVVAAISEIESESEEDDTKQALDTIRDLLRDESEIRPGVWLPSQQKFCDLNWNRFGSRVFEGSSRRTAGNLGSETLNYIKRNHSHDIIDADRTVLDGMASRAPQRPREDEVEFYNRWKDRLAHPAATSLNKKWQKRVFPREILGNDLLSTMSDGFKALIAAAGETLIEMIEPKVLVRAMEHKRAIYWESRNTETLELFRFELQSIRGVVTEGLLWDIDACFESYETSDSRSLEASKIELDLYLVEAADAHDLGGMKTPPSTAPRVRVSWRPARHARQYPISYALVGDLLSLASAARNGAGVFRRMKFAPRPQADDNDIFSMTLSDVNSFNDAAGTQTGRTFYTNVNSKEDLLKEIRAKLSHLNDIGAIDIGAIDNLENALDEFEAKYREAIILISDDPATGFAGNIINLQANAFGKLCNACRRNIPNDSKGGREIRPLIAELGILRSEGHDNMAILSAWHPFRLAERRARMFEFSKFVSDILGSMSARSADLEIAFKQRRRLFDSWVFPQVSFVNDDTMVAVESVSGYTLMAPIGHAKGSREDLEESAEDAAKRFVECLDLYLQIHPHEATSLSAVIYESESGSLPKEIARLLARRIHGNPSLRCDLTITHSDQERLRRIYRDQNVMLDSENLSDVVRGFLSRLRVDVRTHGGSPNGDEIVQDIDLAFLHETISRHAEPEWIHEQEHSDRRSSEFNVVSAPHPRTKVSDPSAEEIGRYLVDPFPPCGISEYQDLLYEMAKSAVLPEGSHATLIQRIQFADPTVKELINGSHRVANWVVTFDNLASKLLFQGSDVQVIREVTVPESSCRVVISARNIDDQLVKNIRDHLKEACDLGDDEVERIVDRVVADVQQMSGYKLLAAARFVNASREMIGLSLMRSVLEGSLPEKAKVPIWLSLDDYRGWFDSGRGKTADVLSVSIVEIAEGFEILIQVGEAKFVSKIHEKSSVDEAQTQVRETVKRLRTVLVDNQDFVSRGAWCSRLAELLVTQDALARRLPNEHRRREFIRALTSGNIVFSICGEAVISLHDSHDSQVRLEVDEKAEHIRRHVLSTPIILETLRAAERGDLHVRDGLRDVEWHRGELCPRPADTQPTSAAEDEKDDLASAKPAGESAADDHEPSNDSEVVEYEDGSESPDADDAVPAAATDSVPTMIPKPVLDVLIDMRSREPSSVDDTTSREWAEETCTFTQRALSHFDMHAEFADPKFRLTPNGVLIGFKGDPTLTVDKLEKKKSEMLTTHGIDVVDIRPSRGMISLFVKREPRAQVPLASTWLDAPWPDRETGDLTNFAIGVREDDGNLLFLNLAGKCGGYDEHGPHTLIAGETGSGKGILTQGLLLQLVAFNDPKNVELVLVDPKRGVDFVWLEGVPHMREEIVTERQQAQEAFGRLVHEMDRRYDLFRQQGVADIARYNAQVEPGDRLPRTFLVHDELGSWMAQEKDYRETVLSSVSNLGMKARAAGIHLVLITQRADADAVPPRLRDNMNNRLCLKVQNSTGSTMVLNKVGAERLLGKGHLACQLANQPMPAGQEFFVVQVPYADPDDMERLAEAAKSHWGG